tara:strand:+ start:424 stop:669 length:246 start_codon:yes stop_codon:yes gene_type:complete
MIYTIPFQYPAELPVTELRDLLNEHSVKLEYDFEAPHDGDTFHKVTGTMKNLIGFHRDIDGPGQSFPVDEFKEYVEEYKLV